MRFAMENPLFLYGIISSYHTMEESARCGFSYSGMRAFVLTPGKILDTIKEKKKRESKTGAFINRPFSEKGREKA